MARRLVATAMAGVVLGACAAATGASAPAVPTTAVPQAAATTAVPPAAAAAGRPAVPAPAVPRTTSTTTVPRPVPPAGEVLADAKHIASDVAVRLTTYDAAMSWADVVGAVTADPVDRSALETISRPLHHPGRQSRGGVVYAQLGGFRAERASVMVVVRQEIGPDAAGGGARQETRTLDVRLARSARQWAFEAVASVGGDPVSRPAQLSPAAAAVIDNPRIELPDSARWDIYRGVISPRLLTVLAEVAARAPIAVAVLESGHPHDVFGTGRTSNHRRGRAVDVYRVGDTRVIDGRPVGSPVHVLATWLHRHPGLSELGSPWRLGTGSFTDTVHQDHLHIAVRP